MRRRDRQRWASARTLADLGELTSAWCRGEIGQTPGHCGGPCPETLPYLTVLAAANRAGFVTEDSQAAGPEWTADVYGFCASGVASRLRSVTEGTALTFATAPGDYRRETLHWYIRSCPDAADSLRAARFIVITDPRRGHNDALWPALAKFASHANGRTAA